MSSSIDRIRAATPADATALAELINYAGEGMPLYLWGRMAAPGQDPWEVGRARALREQGGFSYRNAFVAEIGDAVAACLVGYPLAETPEPIDPATPSMFVPLLELEALVPGTWYVNVLATYPELRGRGIGGELLDFAAKLAKQSSLSRLSLIVSNGNHGARRLYERKGYRKLDERPMIKEGWRNDGTSWELLAKDL